MSAEEWTTAEHALRYLARADAFPHRAEGEGALLEQVPDDVRRDLDLGTGDGRLLALLRIDRRQMLGVGLDFSEPMLEAARKRFTDDGHVVLDELDLADPLRALGRFDAIVSSFAIHYLEHERKRSLYGEVFDLLKPGGVFANLEHVASSTHRLHLAFFGDRRATRGRGSVRPPARCRNPTQVATRARLRRRRLLLEVARDGPSHRCEAGRILSVTTLKDPAFVYRWFAQFWYTTASSKAFISPASSSPGSAVIKARSSSPLISGAPDIWLILSANFATLSPWAFGSSNKPVRTGSCWWSSDPARP
jgi:tRNA (cmo5U34)-methyltransferase